VPKKFSLSDTFLALANGIQEGAVAPNITKYKPHEKQYKFHCSYCKKKLYIGGNRSGKTVGGVVEGIWRATCTHPYRPELNKIGPNRGRVVAVDILKGIDQIILPLYKRWCKPSMLRGGSWESAYAKEAKILTFSNGSTIEFMSYEQTLNKFAGTSRHWIHFDEEPPKPIFTECLARLVDTNGEWWITMTPVEGITWIYDELYEPNVSADKPDVDIIEVNTLENPYLEEEGILNLVGSMDKEDTETRIGGGFVRKGGRVYKNFDPTPGAKQVLADVIRDPRTYFPADRWMWLLALDHGLNNPTAVLWMAINDDGFIVIFDEWYKSEFTVEQHANVIKQKIKEHGRFPDLLVADPSISQRNAVSNTSIKQEYQKYGLSFILGNNDIKSGIVRVKKYLGKTNYPGEAGRLRHPMFGGTAVLPNATDDLVIPSEDGFYPRLSISPRCGKLIWELKGYRWKTYTDKKKAYENNPYDEPHKKDDHACDALRYAIMTRPDLVIEQAYQAVDKTLRTSGDFDIADPMDRLRHMDEDGMWSPEHPLPKETRWDVDEHMGTSI
jgi:phage terminase large subunit-like protein